MTNEEAKRNLVYAKRWGDKPDDEALEMAIKALEQKDALEKVRAEIANHCGFLKKNHCRYCPYCNSVMGIREILKVIDKYKAESEE